MTTVCCITQMFCCQRRSHIFNASTQGSPQRKGNVYETYLKLLIHPCNRPKQAKCEV